MDDYSSEDINTQGLPKRQKKIVYILFGLVIAYYLWSWHRDHVLQYWPFAIFLLCPLMHSFMHGGHGGDGGHGGHSGGHSSGGNDQGNQKQGNRKDEKRNGCH